MRRHDSISGIYPAGSPAGPGNKFSSKFGTFMRSARICHTSAMSLFLQGCDVEFVVD